MIDFKKSATVEMEKTRDIILGFPWESREAYAMWLVQTFHMVNHSTRLVALAGGLTSLDQNDLHARFVDHSKEERGHQLIAINDLKGLGYTVKDFPCLYQSASMYQVQYYWIQHRGPSSFFGYTLALECLAGAFGPELYRRTSKAHGEKAAVFLKVHSEDDIEHTEKAFKMLSALPESHQGQIQENLELSANLYRAMLVDVQSYATGLKGKKVA
jgi:hypothetical protein